MHNIITLNDDFTINSLLEDTRRLQEFVRENDTVIIDATGIRKIDSAAIQMLVAVQKECMRQGKRLTLQLSNEVKDLQAELGIEL